MVIPGHVGLLITDTDECQTSTALDRIHLPAPLTVTFLRRRLFELVGWIGLLMRRARTVEAGLV